LTSGKIKTIISKKKVHKMEFYAMDMNFYDRQKYTSSKSMRFSSPALAGLSLLMHPSHLLTQSWKAVKIHKLCEKYY